MNNRIGDWMTTFTGRQFWPMDPRSDEVDILDIAHSLSLVCRFGGHCLYHYSVAQHSILTALVVDKTDSDCPYIDGTEFVSLSKNKLALSALLHDASEAYIGDLIRPVKRSLPSPGIAEIESRLTAAIFQRFNIPYPALGVVGWADEVMLREEHRQVLNDGREWQVDSVDGPQIEITKWTPEFAMERFLAMFKEYGGRE